jgi:hypothetical protein
MGLIKNRLFGHAGIAIGLYVLDGRLIVVTRAVFAIADLSAEHEGAILIIDDLSSGDRTNRTFMTGV